MRTFLCLMILGFTLSACNTFNGVGQDLKGAGEAISGSAVKTKEKMSK